MMKDLYNLLIIYSQIWLNLPRDDRHFSYNFLWMIPTLATKQKLVKKRPWMCAWGTKFQQEIILY